MAGNFEGIKTRNFGIEIEMTGLTRCQAAKAIAKVLGGTAFHEGGSYDKYIVRDEQGRTWSIVYDGSVKCVDANGNSASKSSEFSLIRYPERGTCLYRCGNERYLLQVIAPAYKAALFGAAGGR